MLRNFDTTLKTLDGEDFKGEGDKPFTLKAACLMVLGAALPDDDKMTGQQKFDLYKLADRINKGGEVEITAEETTTLKARIAKGYGVMVVGAVYTVLEG